MSSTRQTRGRQTWAAIAILLVLAGIAAGVYLRQFHYDRSAYVASLPSASGAMGAKLDLAELARGLLLPAGPAERFDADNLWVKINGKAEGYLPYGVVRLDCRRLALADQAHQSLEVYAYEMSQPQGALSVFTRQRRSDAQPLGELGPQAYRSGRAIFLVHGPLYVEILPAADSDKLHQAALQLAGRLIKSLPRASAPAQLPGRAYLPEEHMRPLSVSPMPAEQTGFDKLGQLLTAIYDIDGHQAVAFVARQVPGDKTRELADQYVQALLAQGWKQEPWPAGVKAGGAKMLGLAGTYRVVLATEQAIVGVHECEDKTAAAKLTALFIDH